MSPDENPAGCGGEPRAPVGSPCTTCGIEVDGTGGRRTSSRALLGASTQLQISHNDEVYRLTLTRSGKLILHK